MTSFRRPIGAYGWLGVGIVAISFSAIFIKMTTAPASITAMYRMLMTAVLLSPFAARGIVTAIRKLSNRERLILTVSGLALSLHFIFWIHSLFFTSVASSTLMLALQPIFVLMGETLFFKERVGAMTWLYALIAIAGTVVIGWHDIHAGKTALLGDFMSLVGTIAAAAYLLSGKNLRHTLSSVHYSFLVYVITGFLLMLYSLMRGHSLVDYPRSDWELFVLLTLVPTVFGHTLFNTLLKYLPASTIAMSIVGEPIGATLLAYVFFHATIPWIWFVGAIVVSSGILLFLRSAYHTNVSLSET
ncbi:DMT family transporter [Sulfoacidibacillus ferrooxidans]|uniref:EamA domain-containing protein n=1 Tax=Sulfoacidibacillus ferrooxidans TaxID=2005001 RepID=A0A9X1V6J1_9BACL|nr:DMT family transporter [Sulfoacidibacillus ferrooxidans]MCI0182436.1 hypothetical protein [Sulfoacidibacillus ferrooxidans]